MRYRAWAYIWGVFLVGSACIALALNTPSQPSIDWPLFWTLLVLATLAQLFKAEAPNHQLYYATPVFLFTGLLLLHPTFFAILVLVPYVIEWMKERLLDSPHLRKWYLQPFNIAMTLIAGTVAHWTYSWLQANITLVFVPSWVIAATIGAIGYVLSNHIIIGFVLVLARGVSWRESGILDGDSLLSDLVLVLLGFVISVLWSVNPWLVGPALLPLVLMYRALMIPQLQKEAQTDGKTGLLNVRYFTKRSTEEIDRAQRFRRPMAVIMADLDLLRTINNTYGHLAGDVVLTGIGQIIRKNIREYDIAGRFGGEEFAIVLPETELVEAKLFAERLRQAIETANFDVATSPTPIHVTMSFGIACFPHDGMTMTELTHEADVAVYQAKLQGRNRVICAAEVPLSIKVEHDVPKANGAASPYAAAFIGKPAARTPTSSTATESSASAATELTLPVAEHTEPAEVDELLAQPSPDGGAQTHEANIRGGSEAHVKKHHQGLLHLFIGSVVALGIGLTLLGFTWDYHISIAGVILLIFTAVLTELLQTNMYGDNTISVSMIANFMAALLGGIPLVAMISLVIALTAHFRQKRSLRQIHKAAFNWAVHVLAGVVAVLLFGVAGTPITINNLALLAIETMFAALAYYIVESGLIATAIGFYTNTRFVLVWRRQFCWLAGHYLALGFMGMFLSIAYTAFGPVGVVVFTLPVMMLRYAQKQYIERTQDGVRELKRLNAKLSQANNEIIDANHAIQQLNNELKLFNDELLITLGTILDARDPFVGGHAAKVADYASAIGRELGLRSEQIEVLRQAGFLHDIGKIAISERVLHKPDKLTDEEYAHIKTHATLGAAFLQESSRLQHLAPIVRHHHERWDGQGYPSGLSGEAIPFEARVLAVCDAAEAMASDRPYRKGMSVPEVIAEVERCAGTQFDPFVAATFVQIARREGAKFVINSADMIVYKKPLVTSTTIELSLQQV